jgi:hypothetical protein
MVAGPDTAYRAVEDAPAGRNVERGPVIATAHEDVVDMASGLERHLTVHHQRVIDGTSELAGVNVWPNSPECTLSQASR